MSKGADNHLPEPLFHPMPEFGDDQLHAQIVADLEGVGEVLDVSQSNVLSGSFGARRTMFSRPDGITVKVKFTHWKYPVKIYAHWNDTLGRFDYFNRLERQIARAPQKASKLSNEIFERLGQANDMVYNSGKSGATLGGKIVLFFLAMLVVSLAGGLIVGSPDTHNRISDMSAFFVTLALGGLFVSLVVVGYLGQTKKEELPIRPWPNMPYPSLSKNQWNKNLFRIVETLFRDDYEKNMFIADLAACARTSGITYLGRLRPHEVIKKGGGGLIIVSNHGGSSGDQPLLTFPAMVMSKPVIVFDGAVAGSGDKQSVAWDGERFFYTVALTKESMAQHMARFGFTDEHYNRLDQARRSSPSQRKREQNANIFGVVQAVSALSVAPPNPSELFPA